MPFFNLFISLPHLSSLCFMMMILHSSPVPSNYHCAVLLQPLLHASIWRRSCLQVSKQRLGTQLGYVLLLVKQEAGVCFKLLFTDSPQAMRVEWGRGGGGWVEPIHLQCHEQGFESGASSHLQNPLHRWIILHQLQVTLDYYRYAPNFVEKKRKEKEK